MPNNAGNEGRVASSVSIFCIPSHSSVWIHDSIDKTQLPYTFSTHSSLYKSFNTTERHCGYQALFTVLLLLQHQKMLDAFGSEMIDLVSWEQSILRSLYFVNMGIGRG